MGFEPMRAFRPYLVSSEALSTTQPTLRTVFIPNALGRDFRERGSARKSRRQNTTDAKVMPQSVRERQRAHLGVAGSA